MHILSRLLLSLPSEQNKIKLKTKTKTDGAVQVLSSSESTFLKQTDRLSFSSFLFPPSACTVTCSMRRQWLSAGRRGIFVKCSIRTKAHTHSTEPSSEPHAKRTSVAAGMVKNGV